MRKVLLALSTLAFVAFPGRSEARPVPEPAWNPQHRYATHQPLHRHRPRLFHRLAAGHRRSLARLNSARLSHSHLKARAPVALRGALPGPCHTAAAMGGPCGCWTEWNTRGFLDHVREGINWWLAGDWLRFPQAIPVAGTAAVWKNRSHVAPVAHSNPDGSVTVRDYWGTHRVSRDVVVIVDPHRPIKSGWRVAEAWPL